MKFFLLSKLTVGLILFNGAFIYAQTQPGKTKHALIFAVGKYKSWPEISSANDIPYVKAALMKQGFEEQHINILADSKVTIAGIADAFKKLISEIKPGDIVAIHFSSHGEQVEDNNHDEADGYDETIVTWDAIQPKNSNNFAVDQAKYFRDDDFGNYIDQIRKKLGKDGDVVVFMDACHSGTGTRGDSKVRGGAPPFVSKSFKKPAGTDADKPNVFLEGSAANEDDSKLATYVIISAARAEELNHETENEDKNMGSLSYAISKVFATLAPGTTYRSLFADILGIMNERVPDQHPVLEGNGIDRKLFGGDFVDQKKFIEIDAVEGTKLTLKGGLMMGLDTGAKVALYPSNTEDPARATPLASGVISQASSFSSTVMLDKDPGLNQPSAGRVFVTVPAYNIKPVIIKMDAGSGMNFSATENEAITNILKLLPVVRLDGNAELLLLKGKGMDTLKIAGNGYIFDTLDASNKTALQERIRRYTQYKFLQDLRIVDTTCFLEVRLVPFVKGKSDASMINDKVVNGIPEFTVGDSIKIWAKNNTKKDLYLNILDLQPDGQINAIFPHAYRKPKITKEELKVSAGEEKIFPVYFIMYPPTGTETFKIFVSEDEINMEDISNSKGAAPRGNLNALSKLLNNSYNLATRGPQPAEEKAEGSTYSLAFRIKPQ
ncbi:MAG: caspase family protein [Agriterribacter sp.]